MMHARQGWVFLLVLAFCSGLLAGCQQQLDEIDLQTRVARAVETLYAGLSPTPVLLHTRTPSLAAPSILVEFSSSPTPSPSPIPSLAASATWTAGPPSPAETAIPTPQLDEGLVSLGVPGNYQLLGSHARITDLQVWQGRIYIAHGDWTQNTGPVRALAYDPAVGAFIWDENFLFDEEQVEILRVADDNLLVPGGDGLESWEFGNLYLGQPGQAWRKLRSLPGGVHVWDVAAVGNQWAAVGSGEVGDGRIWLSEDGGVTWNLDPAGPELLGVDGENPLNTHAGLFRLNGQVYLSAASGCWQKDQQSWQPAAGCDLADRTIHKYVEWGGVAALVPYFSRPVDAANYLVMYNGTVTWEIEFGQPVLDVTNLEGRLLVLTSPAAGQAQIFSLDSPAAEFRLLLELNLPLLYPLKPFAAWPLALEAWDGWLYLGLQDGQFLRYRLDN
jgi:hypothetical protein